MKSSLWEDLKKSNLLRLIDTYPFKFSIPYALGLVGCLFSEFSHFVQNINLLGLEWLHSTFIQLIPVGSVKNPLLFLILLVWVLCGSLSFSFLVSFASGLGLFKLFQSIHFRLSYFSVLVFSVLLIFSSFFCMCSLLLTWFARLFLAAYDHWL